MTPDEWMTALQNFLATNSKILYRIHKKRGVALAIYQLEPRWLATFGADNNTVRILNAAEINAYANDWKDVDPPASRWISQPATHLRIFVISGAGATLCVNFDKDKGFWIEPGTTDASRARG